jgi:hypothetical protein
VGLPAGSFFGFLWSASRDLTELTEATLVMAGLLLYERGSLPSPEWRFLPRRWRKKARSSSPELLSSVLLLCSRSRQLARLLAALFAGAAWCVVALELVLFI